MCEQHKENAFPFSFNPAACSRCPARCCRGRSGNVWLNADEMQQIVHHLNINPVDAMNGFFYKKENRLVIREQYDGKEFCCIFLGEDSKCSIYPVRPLQCRTFPFWDYYRARDRLSLLEKECPGVTFPDYT